MLSPLPHPPHPHTEAPPASPPAVGEDALVSRILRNLTLPGDERDVFHSQYQPPEGVDSEAHLQSTVDDASRATDAHQQSFTPTIYLPASGIPNEYLQQQLQQQPHEPQIADSGCMDFSVGLGVDVGHIEIHQLPDDRRRRRNDDDDHDGDDEEDEPGTPDEGVDDMSGTPGEIKRVTEWILKSSFNGNSHPHENSVEEEEERRRRQQEQLRKGSKKSNNSDGDENIHQSGNGSHSSSRSSTRRRRQRRVVDDDDDDDDEEEEDEEEEQGNPSVSSMQRREKREYTHLHEYTRSHRHWGHSRPRREPRLESLDDDIDGPFAFLDHQQRRREAAGGGGGGAGGQPNGGKFWSKIEHLFK